MKPKITLAGLMLLIAVLTFGQIATEKKHLQYNVSSFESYSKANASRDMKYSPTWAIHNNWHRTQRNLHLNEPVIKHRLDSLIYHEWNEDVSQWVADSKDEYTYDANGKIIQILEFYNWDQNTNQWGAAEYKFNFTFDIAGKPTQILAYEWHEITSQWVGTFKEEYTYNASSKMTQSLAYEWDESTSQWVPDFKVEYTYDVSGILTQYLSYYWNQSNSQWGNEAKVVYTYDVTGILTHYLGYVWNQSSSQWVNGFKRDYSYDANGNNTQTINYHWDQSASQWYFAYKSEFTYDANGNITQRLETYWDSITNQWFIGGKEEYTYDLTISFSELIVPFYWNDEGYFNKLLEVFWYDWDETTNSWVVEDKNNTYYSQQNVTNVEIIKAETVNISPNPASEYLNISFIGNVNSATFELLDIQGSKVLSKAVVNHEQVTLKELNNGMYIYNLYIEGKKQSGKLIKE